MSFRRCCIPDCLSNRNNVLLHKFPKTEIGLQKWVKCINSEYFRNLSSEELQKLYVCHKHFEKRLTSGKFLRQSAYPSLFTKEELETGIPITNEDSGNCQHLIACEHDYTRKRKHDDHTYSKLFRNPLTEINQTLNTDHNAPSTSGLNRSCENVFKQQKLSPPEFNVTTTETSEPQLQTSCPVPETTVEVHNLPCRTEFNVTTTETSEPQLSTSCPVPETTVEVHNLPCRTDSKAPSTPKRAKRKRLIQKLKSLSPRCQRFYKEYSIVKKKLDSTKRTIQTSKLSTRESFEKLTKKMNPIARKFLWMQINQGTKCKKGRRYSEDEKVISLAFMKQSPKSYKFLKKFFAMPSKSTLNKMITDVDIEAGVNPQIFDTIKKEVETWPENKKYCSLIFDEVSIEPGLSYDKYKDSISGFVELNERQKEFADHALVFMVRGALFKWQQPICFYFCEGATKAAELKNIIKEVTKAIIDADLIPVAFVSDQGTSFQSAFNSMLEDTKRQQILNEDEIDGTIKFRGHSISILYDPPHLIKGMRNNFLNKNIEFEGRLCKWQDIIDVYTTDCKHTEMRLLHKLNDEHVMPDKIKKMKVKNCTRVLSKTVAAALAYTAQFSHYVDGKEVSPTLKNTSELVSFLDDLFDSCNGSAVSSDKCRGKPLRRAVRSTTGHEEFWKQAIEKLKKIQFVDKDGKRRLVPSQKNFIITLKSLQRLWTFFSNKGCKFMRPRLFNSDPIENFFGQVRAYSFRNNDPSSQTFKQIFKSLLITRFISFHSENFNCEEASGEQLLKLKNLLLPVSKEHEDTAASCSFEQILPPDTRNEDIQAEARRERLSIHSRAYTAGWVIKKCLKKICCSTCTHNLCQKGPSPVHQWISYREYKGFKNPQKLTYPAESAVRHFGYIINETNEYLEQSPNHKKITKRIINVIKSKYSFDFLTCPEHRNVMLDYFIGVAVKLTVINWCNIINKILKGVDIIRLGKMSLPSMQKKAMEKYKKKLKNKKLNK